MGRAAGGGVVPVSNARLELLVIAFVGTGFGLGAMSQTNWEADKM